MPLLGPMDDSDMFKFFSQLQQLFQVPSRGGVTQPQQQTTFTGVCHYGKTRVSFESAEEYVRGIRRLNLRKRNSRDHDRRTFPT
jgi:hypothetical protein